MDFDLSRLRINPPPGKCILAARRARAADSAGLIPFDPGDRGGATEYAALPGTLRDRAPGGATFVAEAA